MQPISDHKLNCNILWLGKENEWGNSNSKLCSKAL